MNKWLGTGWSVKLEQSKDVGQWALQHWKWALKRFGRVVQEGVTDSEQAAKEAIGVALCEAIDSPQLRNQDKARLGLRYFLERRPYLAMALTDLLLSKVNLTTEFVEREAAHLELHYCERAAASARTPIPAHPLAFKAHQVALRYLQQWESLGCVTRDESGRYAATPKLKKWVEKNLGERGNA